MSNLSSDRLIFPVCFFLCFLLISCSDTQFSDIEYDPLDIATGLDIKGEFRDVIYSDNGHKIISGQVLSLFVNNVTISLASNDISNGVIRTNKHGIIVIIPPKANSTNNFQYLIDKEQRKQFIARLELAKSMINHTGENAPSLDRPKEPLESQPLDALTLIGTIVSDNINRALIQSPDGIVHSVGINNFIGHNYGRVITIRKKHIELEEKVFLQSEWMTREAWLAIRDIDD